MSNQSPNPTSSAAYSKIKKALVSFSKESRATLPPEILSLIEAIPEKDDAFTGDMLAVFKAVLNGELSTLSSLTIEGYDIHSYALFGSKAITGKLRNVDFTNEEADQFIQGPLSSHIHGVKASFVIRPLRINGGEHDGKYAILDGNGNLVDSINSDPNRVNKVVSNYWMNHYESHNSDWWNSSPEKGLNVNEYIIIMMSVLEEAGVDWKSNLTQEQLKSAELAIHSAGWI